MDKIPAISNNSYELNFGSKQSIKLFEAYTYTSFFNIISIYLVNPAAANDGANN